MAMLGLKARHWAVVLIEHEVVEMVYKNTGYVTRLSSVKLGLRFDPSPDFQEVIYSHVMVEKPTWTHNICIIPLANKFRMTSLSSHKD